MSWPFLALDLATTAGWAYWRPGMDGPRYGTFELPRDLGDELERGFLSLRQWIQRFAAREELKGGYVLIEAAFIRRGGRGEITDKNRLIEWLGGLAREAGTTALEQGATPRNIKHNTMMKAWTGRGDYVRDEGKAASLRSANAMAWTTDDDNAADALGLLFYFTQLHRISVPWNIAGPMYGGAKLKVVG